MKSNLFTILLLLISTLLFSQAKKDKRIYLDSLGYETKEKNSVFFRIVKDYYSKKDTYKVYDYYKSNTLKRVGTSKDKDRIHWEGTTIFYYENGNKKSISNYINSRLNGNHSEWYENGNKKLEGEYTNTDSMSIKTPDLIVDQFWNTENIQKIIDGNGDFEEIEKKSYASGKIKNGFKDGVWKGNNTQFNMTYTEIYENGKLISGVSIDSNNVQYKYEDLMLDPVPKKGLNDFSKHIFTNIKIPENAKGTIYLTFVVETDGSIIDIKILKGLNNDMNKEAVRVLNKYEKWVPGIFRGKIVPITFRLPIIIHAPEYYREYRF